VSFLYPGSPIRKIEETSPSQSSQAISKKYQHLPQPIFMGEGFLKIKNIICLFSRPMAIDKQQLP
jgi:hypothetical protein